MMLIAQYCKDHAWKWIPFQSFQRIFTSSWLVWMQTKVWPGSNPFKRYFIHLSQIVHHCTCHLGREWMILVTNCSIAIRLHRQTLQCLSYRKHHVHWVEPESLVMHLTWLYETPTSNWSQFVSQIWKIYLWWSINSFRKSSSLSATISILFVMTNELPDAL